MRLNFCSCMYCTVHFAKTRVNFLITETIFQIIFFNAQPANFSLSYILHSAHSNYTNKTPTKLKQFQSSFGFMVHWNFKSFSFFSFKEIISHSLSTVLHISNKNSQTFLILNSSSIFFIISKNSFWFGYFIVAYIYLWTSSSSSSWLCISIFNNL